MKDLLNRKMIRATSADDVKVDAENRTLEFSFSSELPVERWFGKEILSHKSGAADLSRLNNAAPLLYNHDMDELIGVVEKSWMGSDNRGYARIRFSKNARAQEIMKDVEDGILRNVSFGYQIKDLELTKLNKETDEREYTATSWEPFEISLVTVPADPTVGIGRSAEDAPKELVAILERAQDNFSKTNAGLTAAPKGEKMDPKETPVDVKVVADEAAKAERVRAASITAMGERLGQTDLARQLVESGKTIDEARAAFLEKVPGKQIALNGREAEVGLTEKELGKFSFLKIMAALANPTDRKLQEAAAFEREVSEAAAVKSGKSARGFMVPVDVLRQKRDLTVGSATGGGYTVATELEAGSFIELLRKKSIVQQAGARVLNGLVGNIAIPRQSGAGTAYWVAESGAPTESQQSVDQVTMSPKTVGAYTDYSRKLLLQSSIDVESFVRQDLATVIALELDRVALYGTGSSNQPAGLKPGLNGYNTASQEINFAGDTPTFAEVISLETAITSLNAEAPNMKYLINATMQGALKGAVKVSSYPVFILENGQMNGYSTMVSNQIASGDVWFGDWSQLILGFWSGLDLMVDPYSNSTSGTVRIVALQDCDIAARHFESFARGNNNP